MSKRERKSKSIRIDTANGPGWIILRADGRWMGRCTVPDGDTTKRVTVYSSKLGSKEKREAEVRAKVAKVLGDPQKYGSKIRGGDTDSETTTLSAYAEKWLATFAGRVRTKFRYGELLRLHILPELGQRSLKSLDSDDVLALMVRKREEGLAAGTVNHMRSLLRAMLRDALRARKGDRNKYGVFSNAAADAKKLPDNADERKSLSVEQASDFLTLATTHPDGPIWTVAVLTGLRQSELLGLCWSDVDLEDCARSSVKVRRSLHRDPETHFWRIEAPKSKLGRRTVDLAPDACEALRRQRSMQAAAHLAAGKRWKPIRLLDLDGTNIGEDLIFTNLTGGPLLGSVVTKRFQVAIAAAGLPAINFHSLRHTAISLLLDLHRSVKEVQLIAGHANPATTLGYAHIQDSEKRKGINELNEALRRGRL